MRRTIGEQFHTFGMTKAIGVGAVLSSTYENVLSISGRGYLYGINVFGVAAGQVKIVVDGTVVQDGNLAATMSTGYALMLHFKQTLVLQAKGDGNTSTRVAYAYGLE